MKILTVLGSGAALTTLLFACSSSDNKGASAVGDAGAYEASVLPAIDAALDTTTIDAGGDGSLFDRAATLTDDFERADPAGGPMNLTVDGAEISAIACSNPQMCSGEVVSLKSSTPGSAGEGTFLSTSLAGGPEAPPVRRLRFDFALALGNGDDTASAQVQVVELALTNNAFVFLAAIDGKLVIADQFRDPDDSEDTNTVPLVDLDAQLTWARYELFVDLDHSTAVLTKNGVAFPAFTLRSQVVAERLDALRMGITYTDGGAAVEEDFDNLGLTFF